MTVAFDAQGHSVAAPTTSTTVSGTPITVGSGSNRALCVGLSFGGTNGLPTGITVTWDVGGTNQALAAVTGATASNATSLTSIAWYALANPTSGAKTLTASWTGGRSCVMGAASFTGVDQTGGNTSFAHGTGNTGSTTTATITVTSASGNFTVGMYDDDGGTAINSTSATQDFIETTAGGQDAAMNHTAGSASNTMTATLAASDAWAAAGFDIVASAAAANPFIPYDPGRQFDIPLVGRDLSQSLNLNLFKNPIPFGPYDYSDGPFRVRQAPFDLSLQTNLLLYKNPIPFGPYDWSAKPKFIPSAPRDLSWPLNLELYKNPFPINNGPQTSNAWGVSDLPGFVQPYNNSLYSVSTPFALYDWSRPSLMAPSPPNISLLGSSFALFNSATPVTIIGQIWM